MRRTTTLLIFLITIGLVLFFTPNDSPTPNDKTEFIKEQYLAIDSLKALANDLVKRGEDIEKKRIADSLTFSYVLNASNEEIKRLKRKVYEIKLQNYNSADLDSLRIQLYGPG